jgi:Transposase IS66 family
LVRHLRRELDALGGFLLEHGVETTNNRAERALRCAVTWRKRSQGTVTEKGARWVERILSLKETCRLQARSTYTVLVDAVRCYFHGQLPNTAWLSFAKRQLCLPVIGYEISGLGCRCYPTCVTLLGILGCWLHPAYTGAFLFSGIFR